MCLGILPESMVVMKPQESIITPGTGITDSCKLPCGGWELNLGPWAEQSVLLTADPSFQCPDYCFVIEK